MKIMKIYEIQKNYKMHKDRLLAINTIDNKVRTFASLQKNINSINSYKRKKILSEVFVEKEKIEKISNQNENLRNRMIEVNKREQELIKNNHSSRKIHSSSKSLKSSQVCVKLRKENIKFRERLMQTKSSYYNLHNTKRTKKNSSKRKKEVLYLLENQLGIRPSVIFPQVRKDSREVRSTSKQAKSHFRHYTENHTEGLNALREKNSFSSQYSMDLQSS